MASPAIDFIKDIVGAQDVIAGKTATASGVQVQGDQLIIKLVQPAGDFLARLTMPFFQAIMTDMPITPDGLSVYPSAGPYFISSRVPGSSQTLQRNPYYGGSRPANADQIQYTIGTTLAAQELRVINGETDLGGFPPADAASLAATYGVNTANGQFHVDPQNTVWYVNLNTSRPPFNDLNLRKAVNYAVDRPLLAAQLGAYAGTPTDQILPPGIPGYRDANIYPLNGPDYDKARALAGDWCGTVKLWSFNTSFGPAWANVLKTNLEQIGLHRPGDLDGPPRRDDRGGQKRRRLRPPSQRLGPGLPGPLRLPRRPPQRQQRQPLVLQRPGRQRQARSGGPPPAARATRHTETSTSRSGPTTHPGSPSSTRTHASSTRRASAATSTNPSTEQT
jgi:hypothetical protein